MFRSNLLSTHFQKRETCLKWLLIGAAYCLLFSFISDPAKKTISLIAKEHLWLFMFFCVFYCVAMICNYAYMFKNFNVSNKAVKIIGIGITAIFPLTLTTLMPPLEANGEITLFATVVHWIAGFGNIFINATISLVCFLLIAKKVKSKKVYTVFGVCTAVCVLDLVAFLLLTLILKDPQKSKNGIFEIIPLAVTFVAVYLINHTDLISSKAQRDASENSLVAKDESAFSSVCFAALVLAFSFFTFFAFVRNPIHYTISMTGIDYKGGFALVCVLLSVGFVLNFVQMFKKSGYKNRFIEAVSMVGSVALLACIASPSTLEKNISMVHTVGALAFFYLTLASMFFWLVSRSKQNKKYRPFAVATILIIAAMTATIVVLFVVLQQRAGRTGLTEVIPLEFMFTVFFLENNTDYFSLQAEKQKNVKA